MRERAVILARGLGTRMRQATDVDLDPDQARAAETGAKAMMPITIPHAGGGAGDQAGAISLAVPRLHPLRPRGRRLHRRVPGGRAHYDETMAHYYEGAGRPRRVRLAFAVQDEPIGTANAVAAAEAWTGDDPFLVINGDNYYAVRTLASLVGRGGRSHRAV